MHRNTLFALLLVFTLSTTDLLAEETVIVDQEEGIAIVDDGEGNIAIADEDGNTIAEDDEGNLHVEDEDGNYVKTDKHGNVLEVEDEDGNTVSFDKKGNVIDADVTDEDGTRVIVTKQTHVFSRYAQCSGRRVSALFYMCPTRLSQKINNLTYLNF